MPGPATQPGSSVWNKAKDFVARGGLPFLVFLVFVLMSLVTRQFLTVDNMLGLALEMCILLIVACGMTFVILTGGIDLSVSSVFAFAGILAADALRHGAPPLLGVAVGLASGALVGWINGFLVTKGAVPPFIATLALMVSAKGAALVYSRGYPVGIPIESGFLLLGSAKVLGVPFPIIVAILAFVISYIVLAKTHFGRDVYAVGGNAEAARLSGIDLNKVLIWVYTLSGVFASVGAMIYAARLYTGLPSAGRGMEMNSIAAVVLGGTSLNGGEGKISGTLLGVLLMATLTNGMVLLGISADFQYIVQGAVIVFAIQFDRWRAKYRLA
jgi:ribose transport system permease protein